ncbi:pectin acetylesterase 8-like [Olea europaea var. sylvestris]|uniref:pectin acetylesterase 8-like n=1 Tax=Olea europaea var. sylvestris TaxID=158386 RepID=UPI000C1CFE23|nr:pectin acetylesterase 8-like [Olea europaea var. sylvestris]
MYTISCGTVCLDGSPPAYHFDKGFGDGIDNWLVYLEGGGWCETESECKDRALSIYGSSFRKPKVYYFNGVLSNNQMINPEFYNWNRVFVRYCDGSSFAGNVEAVNPATNLYYRGARIFKVVMEDLLEKGMKYASNAILTGCSAGGLATILNCDRFRALVPSANRVKCISDSGYFIHAKDVPGVKRREKRFAGVVRLHELSNFLPSSCTSKRNPSLCLFPEYLVKDMETPLFLLNSLYDSWQITYNLKPHHGDEHGWKKCTKDTKLCSPGQLKTIRDFRMDFLKSLQEIGNSSCTGMFINSCYLHCYTYSTERWNCAAGLGNTTIAQAIGDWYFDRDSFKGIDTMHDVPQECTQCL